jgi:peptidyl-prolyl cis-trans isomerase A (cyclophilin A)
MMRARSLAWLGLLAAGALLGEGRANAQATQGPSAESGSSAAAIKTAAPVTVSVTFKTTLGDIVMALETERAPVTASNFLRYIDQKRYDGTTFYRAVAVGEDGKYGLIQGGLRGNLKREFKPIALEPTSTTGLSHVDGAISMARGEPNSATSDFFIIIGGLTSLDAQPNGGDPGYAVFGHVVDGMDVVRAIMTQPTSPTEGEGVMKGQMLAMPVKVLSARRTN